MVNFPDILTQFSHWMIKTFSLDAIPFSFVGFAAVLIGILCVRMAQGFVGRRLERWIEKAGRYGRIDRQLGVKAIRSFLSLLPVVLFFWGLTLLPFPAGLAKATKFACLLIFAYSLITLLANLAGFVLDALLRGNKEEGTPGAGAGALMPIIRAVVWAIGLTFLMDNLGFKISSIVAGLGIVGIAVGLAAQTILGDFFSYLVILMDRPFSLGDSVTIGNNTGIVEHLGIKTLRLRTVTGEILIIPNGDVTKQGVRNLQFIQQVQKTFTLGVTYETPTATIRKIPKIIEDISKNISGLQVDWVYFSSFGDFSLNFDVQCSMSGRDAALLRGAIQEFNFGIMERFAEENITFAYPTQSVYLSKIPGPSSA